MGDNGLEEELEKTQAVEECAVGGENFGWRKTRRSW